MRRRKFLGVLSGAAAWPVAARAQQPTMPVVGFLNARTAAGFADLAAAFRQGLSEAGFNEGHNVRIEYRWADGNLNRLRPLADELVRQRVAVIAAAGGGHVIVPDIKTVPIVFTYGGDPVEAGLVTNINRPGGNATGVLAFSIDLEAKRLELLQELVPRNAIIGVLLGPADDFTSIQRKAIEAAAHALGRHILAFYVNTDGEMDKAFLTMGERRITALAVTGHPFFMNTRARLLELVAGLRIPAIFESREFTAAGGLMSYGTNIADMYRQIGVYVGRILKGEKAADLPVTQPTKFDVSVNLRTAKALGIEIPVSILLRADEVIE